MNPIRQLLHFAGVGVINSLIDAVMYVVLSRGVGLPPLMASALSFFAGSVNSFLLNKHFTFVSACAGREMARQYVKFLGVTVLVLSVHQLNLAVWHHLLGLPDVIAKAVGILSGVMLGFRLNRRWVFGLNLSAGRCFGLSLPSLPGGRA